MQYNEILKAYHNSAAYQTWVANKGKADVEVEHEEQEKRSKREVGLMTRSKMRSDHYFIFPLATMLMFLMLLANIHFEYSENQLY